MRSATGIPKTAPVILSIRIRGTQDRPIILSDHPAFDVRAALVESDAPLSTTGPVPFDDLDRADTPEATVDTDAGVVTTSAGLSLPPAQIDAFKAGFSISNPANGPWSYDIAAADVEFLNAGERVRIVYDVVVTDDFGRSVDQPVVIVIVGTNDAPIVDFGAAIVSEEGLPGGVPDPFGPSDTTNSTTETGTINIESSVPVDRDAGRPGSSRDVGRRARHLVRRGQPTP